jgi:IS5 family transposase
MVAAIPGWHRITLGADKGYDRKEFVAALRDDRVTPHLACKATTILDERTTRHPGYLISQQKRKRIEEIFGWLKTVAGLRKTRHRGAARVGWMFRFALAAYNLVRAKGPESSRRGEKSAEPMQTRPYHRFSGALTPAVSNII